MTPGLTENLQSQRIYRQLRKAIMTCELQPEVRLRVIDIAGREAVSPGAVREALSALTSEHLVIPLPQRGFRVAPMSRADMFDLFTTRAELESRLAGQATAIGRAEWRATLSQAWQAMAAYGERPTISEGAAAEHEAFHRALIADCGSVWSLRLFDTLYAASERYRYFAYRYLVEHRDSHREHTELHAAAIAGDDSLVRDLCRAHILRTRDLLDTALRVIEAPVSEARRMSGSTAGPGATG
jgi:DNA-binding GntR family transcriptional regulator